MISPPLVRYGSTLEYREHYERTYCTAPIMTADNIPVRFRKSRFNHAFFESSKRDHIKDEFSITRAQRINWIKSTLQNPNAGLYCGWDKSKKRYDPMRRVHVAYDEYVVVIQLFKKPDGRFTAEFRTAFVADNSIGKIRTSPKWAINAVR